MTSRLVALVDDHALVVHTLTAALQAVGVECAAVAPRPAGQLLAALIDAEPSVVLLDLDLGPFGDSMPLIAPLADAEIRVVLLTAQTDRIRLAEAIEQGAVRVVPKSTQFADLVATIRRVTLTPGVRRDPQAAELLAELAAHRARSRATRQPFDRLTIREKETLAALAAGWTVHDIAARWVVAETTVRSHVRSILSKLDVQSQLQAVVRAVHYGWISPDAAGAPAQDPLTDDPAADERAS